MSEHLNGKDYSDYFKSLEQRLSGGNQSAEPAAKPEQHRRTDSHKSRGGIYKVIRVRRAVLALVLTAVLIMGVSVCLTVKNRLKGAEPQSGEIRGMKAGSDTSGEAAPPIAYSFTDRTQEIPASNDCEGAIIINTETHEVVAARNPHKRLYPASTTKIMSLIVACENIKSYDDTFTMTLDITDPLYVAGASVAGFLNGEVISMTDLLYGLILPSGADAAAALAIKTAGSEADFAALMNRKAAALGLNDTRFVNASGLFDSGHYTTAYDMAVILETAMQNPLCKKILSTYQYTTASTPQHPQGIALSSTLFDYMYGTEPETATISGGKTGFVNESGYCIASYGSANDTGNEYIVVTLKNSSHWPAVHGQIDLYKQFAR